MRRNYFNKTFQLLNQIDKTGITYNLKIQADSEGYIDKECPKCKSKFKVFNEDLDNRIKSNDKCYCPFCGHVDRYNSWWTTEQLEQARSQAVKKLQYDLMGALEEDAQVFDGSSNGFIKITMSVSGEKRFIDFPSEALEEMQQKVVCENCGTRYAVIGAAFFCPCCGHNSAPRIFFTALSKVRTKISNLESIGCAIKNKDTAKFICQSLIESSISDLVVALQRLSECIYHQLSKGKKLKKNVFQRIVDSNELWREICGKDYHDWLSSEEYNLLIKCFQQRHILQHKDGIVDQDYLKNSGDTTYNEGQRLVINIEDIVKYLDVFEKIGKIIISLKD